jgi:serine/threonine protein kinase
VDDRFSAPDTLDGYCLAEEVIHALACGGLEDGQRSEALAHLDDCELCQALLADEVRALPRSGSADDAGLPTLIQLDALVAGRYRIQRFVARGGMGEVYEAWDGLLCERVALKTINPVSATADQDRASARFKQEVQLSRRVGDPHVCRIYEFGQHVVRGFGTISYLTMEYIEGQTLGARLRQGPPLAMAEVVQLCRQMLRGLAAAHAVGVLHRDFKSDNVMLKGKSAGPAPLHAVIMDFGLARLLGDQAHRLTERHELVGSAAYMAPEQLEDGASLSEATDIYAFGVVLFEMLTGRLPFEGKSAVAVALRRLTHTAPPPSLHVPELAGAWDALVLRCLERDVARRFSTTLELAAALEVVAAAPTAVEPARPRSRRIAIALALAAAVGGVSSLALSRSSVRGTAAQSARDVTLTLQLNGAPPSPSVSTPTSPSAPEHAAALAAPSDGEASPAVVAAAASPTAASPTAASPTAASQTAVASTAVAPAPAAPVVAPAATPAPAPSSASPLGSATPSAQRRPARTAPVSPAHPAAPVAARVAPSVAAAPGSAPAALAPGAPSPPATEPAADVRELFFLEAPPERSSQNAER